MRWQGGRCGLKAECLQHTGSFKARGGWSALSALSPEVRARGVIAYSSGNHAQGVARAAAAFGVPAVIVMPADAPGVKIANTRALGAEVVLYDRATEDRDAIGAGLAKARGLTLVKPYDDPQVIAGQGTIGLELLQDLPAGWQGEVLVPCGGGGMTAGIALALEGSGAVRPVEPEGFDDTARSLASGRIERNARLSGSVCDAIITPSPGLITFPILQRLCGAGAGGDRRSGAARDGAGLSTPAPGVAAGRRGGAGGGAVCARPRAAVGGNRVGRQRGRSHICRGAGADSGLGAIPTNGRSRRCRHPTSQSDAPSHAPSHARPARPGHIAACRPFIENRAAEQPDHVWPHRLIHHRFLRQRNTVIEPGQLEPVFDLHLVEHLVGGEILDA